jgi:hypothetical protein
MFAGLAFSAGCDGGSAGPGGSLFAPSADTTLAGRLTLGRLVIPAGVTVRASGALVLEVADSTHIAGALVGDCQAIHLSAGGHIVVTGRIANGCTTLPPGGGPPLDIIASGGLTLEGAEIVSAGDLTIADDPSLRPPFSAAPSATDRRLTPAQDEFVRIRASQIRAEPVRATDGQEGPTGSAGASGESISLLFRRGAVFEGVSLVRAQSGGHGGRGVHETVGLPARAVGGDGGAGGAIILVSGGTIFTPALNGLTLISGAGGRGGDARASAGGAGEAPGAEAIAGSGAAPGRVTIQAEAFTSGVSALIARVGAGGGGGLAEARGGEGRAASAAQAASDGGSAIARGGSGASIAKDMVTVAGAGLGKVRILGNPAGAGGSARATGGGGGSGSAENRAGGRGGTIEAHGGAGGGVALLDEEGGPTFVAANGGGARFAGGRGGDGGSGCQLGVPGGAGGRGGDAVGGDGLGGVEGRTAGQAGGVVRAGVGNGGGGGPGAPPGAAGPAGVNRAAARGGLTIESPSFQPGAAGAPCPP